MIKTVVVPDNNNIQLSIPNNYVGKEIQVLLYATEELKEQTPGTPSKNAARFKGTLSKEEAEKFHQYLKSARGEWDRDI